MSPELLLVLLLLMRQLLPSVMRQVQELLLWGLRTEFKS